MDIGVGSPRNSMPILRTNRPATAIEPVPSKATTILGRRPAVTIKSAALTNGIRGTKGKLSI